MIFIGNSSPPLTFLSHYSAASRSFIPTTDAGGVSGNLMVAMGLWGNGDPVNYNSSIPSGWSDCSVQYGSDLYTLGFSCYAKRLDGTETNPITLINSSPNQYRLD